MLMFADTSQVCVTHDVWSINRKRELRLVDR